MGGRDTVLDMTMIDALETLILVRMETENEYNVKKKDQATEFNSMLIAAMHVNGGGNSELEKVRNDHLERLTEMIGQEKEVIAEKEMSKFQWPKHVQDAIDQQTEGR